jgi:hypothetical protein
MEKHKVIGPVAIGGVGGSGTRVFAEILRGLGLYMGNCLNNASDNLWFTLLLKRPHWFFRNQNRSKKEIYHAIRIFEKAMTTGLSLTAGPDDITYVRNAGEEISSYALDMGANRLHAKNILKSRQPDPSRYIGWGWKEPNTHIFLEYLAAHFPDFHYIHVLRHGLDMAYSTNNQQLLNWGTLVGVTVADKTCVTPRDLLQYWVAANERAIKVGRMLLGERFLLVRLEELCRDPKASIKTMASFVGVDMNLKDMHKLARLPSLPASSGRYRNHDLAVFAAEDIKALERLGFEV